MRVSAFVTFQVHQSDVMSDQSFSFFFDNAFASQPKVNIVINRFPGKQGELLKNNCAVWAWPAYLNIVYLHTARTWKLQTRGHSHAGCFSAT